MSTTTTFAKTSISSKLALEMIAKAEQKAAELNLKICVAIVDESGLLKAFSRMDGAPLLAIDIAKDKAWTAVSFGISTDAWHDFIKGDPPLLDGITKVPRLIVFGGGYPIQIGGEMVGGIGVSGGHYSHDMQCAQAALTLVAK
jgi:uncharacterized protein GlcG (DUF336 family)